ncbi:MAG: phage integrase N-terminal SAM-like domain-containing protein [Bacteroidota bacterium]|nr:phage integrase N-terminal SAM-like domain-containing protein [Bacteroidota bacterium]MDE2835795.1 phage integrase N-terminal SAM-like domain-containing protein [Bacteroidota bacterium]MDE2956807.1 phage integrase N-terminal SAM-like domain-containing protein [Bacteroidota bacterium]
MSELKISAEEIPSLRASEIRQRLAAFESEYLIRRTNSASTAGTYTRSLNEFIRWINEHQAGQITLDTETVAAYQKYLKEHRKLAPSSVTVYLRALKHFCEYLIWCRLITSNPFSGITLDTQPSAQPREILTQDEAAALLKAIDATTESGARDHALVACMLYGGLNDVQIVQAHVRDLDITAWGWRLRMDGASERGMKQISLDAIASSSLENYLNLRSSRRMSDPLFVPLGPRGRGKRLTTRTVHIRISAMLNNAGIVRPGITPGSLRLTAVLLWLKNGVELEEIRQRVTPHALRARVNFYTERGLITDGILG